MNASYCTPWQLHKSDVPRKPYRIVDGYGANIAEILWQVQTMDEEQAEANARLIAASPTMYEYIKAKAQLGDEDAAKIIATIER